MRPYTVAPLAQVVCVPESALFRSEKLKKWGNSKSRKYDTPVSFSHVNVHCALFQAMDLPGRSGGPTKEYQVSAGLYFTSSTSAP